MAGMFIIPFDIFQSMALGAILVVAAAAAVALTLLPAILSLLGGGCQLALGAYATVERDTMTLTGLLAEETGPQVFKATSTGSVDDPEGVAGEVYRQLVRQGATVR